MPQPDDLIIQRVEESMTIDKRRVLSGRVRISTKTQLEDKIAKTTLSFERVEVTRHAIDCEIDAAPQVRMEGDTTVIPVVKEIAVMVKKLVLVEEIRIRRVTMDENVEIPVSLRKQQVTVERLNENQSNQEHCK